MALRSSLAGARLAVFVSFALPFFAAPVILTSALSLLLGAPLFPLAFPAAFAYLFASLAGGGDLEAAFFAEAFTGPLSFYTVFFSSLRLFDRAGALAGIFLDLSSCFKFLIYDIYLCGFSF